MAKKRIYTVATAHLDTIWSWDFETTVSKYIYRTLVDNFYMFKKYPNYTFSFEGSYRYELMEEYYPEMFEQLKEYIKEGRWHVTGSAYENGDVNCPSPEALFRNILIGNSYFDEKFGKRSLDIYLPDCFGFGWALPSVAHHAHLTGFTTQKLTWGSAYGNPFDIGKWVGVDGESVYASLQPNSYSHAFDKLRNWDYVQNKLKKNDEIGLDWTYMFHGVGDRGGCPDESSIKYVEDEMKLNENNDVEVIAASADQIYRDIDKELPDSVKDKLPTWNTELVMTNHGVGGYTSRTIGKRWNAKCQELGDVAERAGVMASYLGTAKYNEEVLEKSWKRAIAHQFHDDTPGTSVQRAYRRSWNDYALSINQFSGEIEASLASVTPMLDSSFCQGIPVAVSNALEVDRCSAVRIKLNALNAPYVKVFDSKGNEVPSQIVSKKGGISEILFLANVASLGIKVYDVRPSKEPCDIKTSLVATENSLENDKYIVKVNNGGNICSIIDKSDNNRELIKKPIVLGLFDYKGSDYWPAWEMNYDEINKQPSRIPELVSLNLIEKGPVRVSFEIVQKDKKSAFKTYVSLTQGSEIVEVFNEIEWQSMRTLAKNIFNLAAINEKAKFDLGLGAIERGNMTKDLFEIPAQKWADISDKSGEFGISIISECKHGWDKFDDNTLRLTAVHTPRKNYRIDSMQSVMDLGKNIYGYAIFSHKGEAGAETQLQSRLYTYPLTAVTFNKHSGEFSEYSFGQVSTNDIIIRALKKAHHRDDEIIVRFNEGTNKEVKNFEFCLGNGIVEARELWASEEYRGEAKVEDGKLICDFKPYEVKTFGIKLSSSEYEAKKSTQKSLDLTYNAGLEDIPESLMRDSISVAGVDFKLGKGTMHADGQALNVKDGNVLKLLIAAKEARDVFFKVNGKSVRKHINGKNDAFARWDLYDFKETAYISSGHLGYEFTHSVDEDGKVQFAKGIYFYVLTLNGSVELPKDKSIIILAATEVEGLEGSLVTPLQDEVENNRPFTFKKDIKEWAWYLHSKCVWMLNDKENFISHNNNGKNGKKVEPSRKYLHSKFIDKRVKKSL